MHRLQHRLQYARRVRAPFMVRQVVRATTRSQSYNKKSELQLYQQLGKSRRACIITVGMIEERLLKRFTTLRLQSTRFLGQPLTCWGQWSSERTLLICVSRTASYPPIGVLPPFFPPFSPLPLLPSLLSSKARCSPSHSNRQQQI